MPCCWKNDRSLNSSLNAVVTKPKIDQSGQAKLNENRRKKRVL